MAPNHTPIDWVGLADALLSRAHTLVPQWLPAGFQKGDHWYIGDFDGGEGKSANVNLKTGQWYDNAGGEEDKGGDLISLYGRIQVMNNGQAARELMRMLGWERVEEPAGRALVRTSAQPEPPPWTEGEPAPADAPAAAPPAPAAPVAVPGAKGKPARWLPIVPVPAYAPRPTFVFGYRDGKKTGAWVEQHAVRSWRYEFNGELFGHVARYERIASDGVLVKDTLPWTWCEDTESGEEHLQRWSARQWPIPRPLYLPRGRLRSELPVVVVEGEKCAEAGDHLLGEEFDFVSWPGGCKTWQMADWPWIKGRTVIMWPDCDAQREPLTKAEREAETDPALKPLKPAEKQPGTRAMVGLGSRLVVDVGCTVFMCEIPPPGLVAAGWDIADAIAEGWSAERVRNFIRCAPAFVPPEPEVRAALGTAVVKAKPADAAEPEEDDDELRMAWRRRLSTTDKGAIHAVRENVVVALNGKDGVKGLRETEGLIAFNEFTNNVVKTRPTPWGTPAGPWEETDELLMGMWLMHEHQMPSMSRQALEEAVVMVARLHSYHPVRAEVEACRGTWDGVPRLGTWLERVCLKEGELQEGDSLRPYLARVGTWLMMAICVRVLPEIKKDGVVIQGPGTKFDYMTIFEGPQGWGKSTLAAVLGGSYFADTGLELGNKDSYQNLQGIRVYEWGELDSLTRSEVTKVKQFISSQKDRFRASFDRRPKDYPRQVVFIGTTNEDHYLTDPTGNRRFWPVRITRPVDIAWVRANLLQMVAEAIELLDARQRFHPTPAEQRTLFDPQQGMRTVESAVESAIRTYLYDEDQKVPHGGVNGSLVAEIGMGDLLSRIGFTVDKQTDVIMKKAGAVMKRLGWPVRRSSSEGRPRFYVRPPRSEADAARGSDGSSGPAQGSQSERLTDDCPF